MNIWTRGLLIVLRLAIGWHFLFEGLDKLDSLARGPVDGKPVWSSEAYLRESSGPLAPFFRGQAGDLDAFALERLTIQKDDSQQPRLPPALEKEWDDAYQRFVAHYEIGDAPKLQPEMVAFLAVGPGPGFSSAV